MWQKLLPKCCVKYAKWHYWYWDGKSNYILFVKLFVLKLINRRTVQWLAGSTCGCDANCSALSIVYSAAKYCCPVVLRSSLTSKVDTQINASIVTWTLRSTPLLQGRVEVLPSLDNDRKSWKMKHWRSIKISLPLQYLPD